MMGWRWLFPQNRTLVDQVDSRGVCWSPDMPVGWKTIPINRLTWPEPELEDAICVPRAPAEPDLLPDGPHQPPHLRCTCGYYSYKAADRMWRHVRWRHQHGQTRAVGSVAADGPGPWLTTLPCEVELSGRVIEHRLGWRAQRYRIRRVAVPAADVEWVPTLLRRLAAAGLYVGDPDDVWSPFELLRVPWKEPPPSKAARSLVCSVCGSTDVLVVKGAC